MYGGHCVISRIGTSVALFLKFEENCVRYSGINSFHLSGSQKARDPVITVGFRVGFVMDKLVHGQAQLGFFSASDHSSSTAQTLLLRCARAYEPVNQTALVQGRSSSSR
jgi:hypothetical protein